MIETGSDFSGVGAFDQALIRSGIDYKTIFACDMDKYARQTYIENYGEPEYYPENVYDRKIPKKPLDIYMTSPPCQSFSLAGKRKGEKSVNGVLFYNSHEFIQKNNPRYFIFENVKGLLSDANGRTFQIWLDMLGGKSINGNPVIFPREDAVPYHIYHKVLNAKNYGVPQNRERVFIIGIRDDADNTFTWPKPFHLVKRLKDVLEVDVDQKYYLSDKMIDYLNHRNENTIFGKGKLNYKDENDTANCITKSSSSLDISDNIIKVGNTNPSGNGMNGNVFDAEGISPTLSTNKGEGIKVKSATKKGYETAQPGDTACNQAVMMGAIRGRGNENNQQLELNKNGTSNALTTVQKDNVVIQLNQSKESGGKQPYQQNRVYSDSGIMTTLDTDSGRKSVFTDYKIRRLTPRECFRLMDFPDTFKMPCSNSQMYKQAGNSIVVTMLELITTKLTNSTHPFKSQTNQPTPKTPTPKC
jgi:DNA (cytosine-5)-methyltransferase 1